MAFTPKVMVAGSQLTNAAVTYFTATKLSVIHSATIVNTSAAAHTATIHRIPTGGTASAANTLISAFNLGPGESYPCPELVGKVLNVGDFVQALADAGTVISFQMAGMEIG